MQDKSRSSRLSESAVKRNADAIGHPGYAYTRPRHGHGAADRRARGVCTLDTRSSVFIFDCRYGQLGSRIEITLSDNDDDDDDNENDEDDDGDGGSDTRVIAGILLWKNY